MHVQTSVAKVLLSIVTCADLIHEWLLIYSFVCNYANVVLVCLFTALCSLKEVDIGLAADVGTLQRLPKVVGNNR